MALPPLCRFRWANEKHCSGGASAMDETIRMIIAYAELVIGIPLLIAKLIWLIPSLVLTKFLIKLSHRRNELLSASMEGFIAILLACQIFSHYNLQIAWTIPVVLIVIRSIWHWGEEWTFAAWVSRVSMIIGFLLYPGD
jgi:hypothetical protein